MLFGGRDNQRRALADMFVLQKRVAWVYAVRLTGTSRQGSGDGERLQVTMLRETRCVDARFLWQAAPDSGQSVRFNHAAAFLGNVLYVHGGTHDGAVAREDMCCYDTEENRLEAHFNAHAHRCQVDSEDCLGDAVCPLAA